MKKLIRIIILIFCTGILFAQEEPPKEFKGVIIDTPGAMRSSATNFTMKIEKYTSDEDTKHYATLLSEKGADALVEAIRNLEIGKIVINNRNTYTFSIARTFVKDEKRIVRAVTDRPIAYLDGSKSPRSMDFKFGVVEIELDQNGKGKGILVPAAKIQIKDDVLQVQSFSFDPFRLTSITAK